MDGRDRKDYEASHVPGAISMPYFDLYFEWRSISQHYHSSPPNNEVAKEVAESSSTDS